MSSPNPFTELQKLIRGDSLVCRLKLEAITPVLIGGYDGLTSHGNLGVERLRPLSVKGVWRWWARVLVSAALYKKFGRFPELSDADRIVARFLGTAGVKASASIYQLVITDESIRSITLGEYRQVPRVTLLSLRKEERERERILQDRVHAVGSRYTVELYKRSEAGKRVDAFAICSLLLALTFGGVGKATSRGFGKLVPLSLECNLNEVVTLHNKLRRFYRMRPDRDREEIVDGIKTILNYCADLAVSLLDDKDERCAKYDCPQIETPIEGYYRVIVPEKIFNNEGRMLSAIGHATMKLYWKAYDIAVNAGLQAQQALSRAMSTPDFRYKTWILGLPRYQKSFGYFVMRWGQIIDARRRSPIIFVPIRTTTDEGRHYYVVVLGFKTCDWTKIEIKHVSPLRQTMESTSPPSIDNAFDKALDYIKGVIEMFG